MVLGTLICLGSFVAVFGPSSEAQRDDGDRTSGSDLTVEEYTPRSTLVVEEHRVPRAKYPVIDVHSHHWSLSSSQWSEILSEMDQLNLQVLVNLSGGSGSALQRKVETIEASNAPNRMVHFANLDFGGGVYPGFGKTAAEQLETDVHAG